MIKDYYKSYKYFKIAQLTVLVAFAVSFFCYLYFDEALRQSIFSNKSLLTLCVFLWAFMIYSAVSIIWDFHQLEGNIVHDQYLSKVAIIDQLTGIPNRYGVDQIFEKYSKASDLSNIGCALFYIDNISEINEKFSREEGNKALIEFSNIIESVSLQFGFVGRNSGNEFLAVIENCDKDKMQDYINTVKNRLSAYNNTTDKNIKITDYSILNTEQKEADFTKLVAQLYNNARRG